MPSALTLEELFAWSQEASRFWKAHLDANPNLLEFALWHSQRHWAQLATLVRDAGFPSDFKGDLLFSQALV